MGETRPGVGEQIEGTRMFYLDYFHAIHSQLGVPRGSWV